MKRLFSHDQRRFLLLGVARQRGLRPILLGLLLSLLYFGLLGSPPPAHAEEPIFIDSGQRLGNLTSSDVAIGDLDGDGDLDAFVANTDYSETGQPNRVWLNNGTGSFVLSQNLGSSKSTDVKLGDLDGDGDLDAFVANGDFYQFIAPPHEVVGEANRVWLNDGTGHFTDSGQRLGNLLSMAIALGDIDSDGDLDAFVANIHLVPQLAANRIWLNNGDGTFQDSNLRLGNSLSSSVALADLNGDGYLDAFVANSEICSEDDGCFGNPNNKVWLNRGGLTFEDSNQNLGDLNSLAVELADLNGDGHLDAFVGNGDIFYLASSEQPNKVWLNDGTAHFTDTLQSLGNLDTFGLALQDLDGDGDQDAVVANGSNQALGIPNEVWQNDGSGTFQQIQSFGDSFSFAVAVGDLNNNGQLDILAANVGANELWLNDATHFTFGQSLENVDDTRALAVGDLNGDGHLDILGGNYDQADKIWINNGDGQFEAGQSLGSPGTYAVALGDLDSDGDLDIFIGNNQRANEVWLQNEEGIFEQGQELENSVSTFAIALGDLDHDGDLDAFVAHGNTNHPQPEQPNKVWLNDGTGYFSEYQLVGSADSHAVALGDLDNDNDLDLFIANHGHNEVWLNNGTGEFYLRQTASNAQSNAVALGDLDGDGDLDAFVGNNFEPTQVWLNDGSGYFTDSEQTLVSSDSRALSLADLDGDGDLDVFVGNVNAQSDKLLLNDGWGNFTTSDNHSFDLSDSRAVALGDFSGDGNLDLVIGKDAEQPNQVYLGNGGALTRPQISVQNPAPTEDANFYSSPEILTERTIPISYTLFDAQSAPMGQVKAYYSMDGGDNWQVALPTSDTITINLATAPYSTTTELNRHLFVWDTFASGFFGQSDNVVLRFVAHPQPVATGVGGTYQYTNQVPTAYLWPIAATTTFPFRLRGMQVRVSDENGAVAGAMVYRLPAGQSVEAEALAGSSNQPYRTDQNGYLQGQGQLGIGDQLMAMLPITTTGGYTLYHTSAPPTEMGLEMQPVTTPGVQELQLSAAHPLLIFDLDVSLEWDARRDNIFLSQLEYDLKRTSEILYDLTNGQVALGELHVHHAREQWPESDILIYGSNNLRPSAALGGIVEYPVSERVKRSDRRISETLTISNSLVITDAYFPGQVRMSAIWNRFGHPGGSVGEDWPRTLAHELGHYLLFIPDNYLGLSEEQALIKVGCQETAMTDAYREDYSEFLTRAGWTGDCEQTMAQYTTGRSDWETISTFYEMLNADGGNMGPSHLPLNVTQVSFIEPDSPVNTLLDPFFNVTNEEGDPLALPFGDSQAYLFKRPGPSPANSDVVLSLGSPIADLLRVRGAEPGDRLCIFDDSQTERRIGCIEELTSDASNLSLYEVPGWEPQIEVNVVTSRTLTITVTQQLEPSEALHVQILPASAHLSATAPLPMTQVAPDTFVQAITLNAPIANGFVRLWLPDADPPREAINEISLSGDWPTAGDGSGNGWGPNKRRYSWLAPVRARDGQVTIFDLDHIFGSNPPYALQSLATPSNLPLWLTPVGQAYRFSAAEALTGTLNIMFEYMQREVPGDEEGEERLRIYYLPDGGEGWQRLETELDDHHNLASARIQGEGTYVLISTIEMPALNAGWNNIGYPVADTRPITTALASIDGYYNSVYHYDASGWQLYDTGVTHEQPELASLVNDLSHLEFANAYWLHASEEITLYLGITNSSQRNAMAGNGGLQLPPATFYGWVVPSDTFTPTVGMAIRARIDGNLCGQSTIQELDGRLVYKVQVMAENVFGEPNGCGASGKSVLFEVADQVIGEAQEWDNSQASYHPLPHHTFTTQLVPGWNLVSLSIQPADSATPQVLTSIAGNYTNLYAYDGCDANDPWKNYDPSAPPFANDLTEINASIGLWINMTITDTLEVTGSEVTSATIPLCEDWNLVGYPSPQTRPITDALASIEGHYSIVYGYQAADANDPWKKYDPTAPPFANDLPEMHPGQGYWIKVSQEVTWEIGE